jgi:hypothetical protein
LSLSHFLSLICPCCQPFALWSNICLQELLKKYIACVEPLGCSDEQQAHAVEISDDFLALSTCKFVTLPQDEFSDTDSGPDIPLRQLHVQEQAQGLGVKNSNWV